MILNLRKVGLLLVFLLNSKTLLTAQVQQFTVEVTDTASLFSMPAVHSYALGQWDGKWIIIGGRTNGLHGFTPPSGFQPNGVSSDIYIVDPATDTKISENVYSAFSDTIMWDALQAAFYQFSQHDSMLYITGGYGLLSDSADNYTLPNLIAVNLKQLVNAMQNSQPVAGSFRILQDSVFRVCGGHMYRTDSMYHIVFGHDFSRSYSVNDTLGFFKQQYTCEVRSFKINDDGVNLSISDYSAIHDSANFHRRDYNLVPQIFPDGSTGQTAFSGVFQYFTRMPYLNTVNINDQGYEVVNTFNQNLSQYASAFMPVYNSADNKMSTVFFGGMSLYTFDAVTNSLLADSLIPFVPTISKVVRNADSTMVEYVNPTEMPGLIGTNSLFIADSTTPMLQDGIIDLNALPYGITRVGSIIGGINSDLPNVSSTPLFSYASGFVFRVYLNKFVDTKVKEVSVKNDILNLIAYPNPTDNLINIEFEIPGNNFVTVTVYDSKGNLSDHVFSGKKDAGKHSFKWQAATAGMYFCKVQTDKYTKSIKVVVR